MQNQKVLRFQRRQRIGPSILICKLNIEGIRRVLLHDSTHLSTHKLMLRQVVNQSHYIILFDLLLHDVIVPLRTVRQIILN